MASHALVDNGAIGTNGNVVSPDLARLLISLNLAVYSTTPTTVCNFNNECETLNDAITFSFNYQSERDNEWRTVELQAVIGRQQGVADVIIGREAIKKV
jgi:hypothetical protein